MIQGWILILTMMSVTAFASDFNHIKLSSQFEQYLTRPKLKSASPYGAKSLLGAGGVVKDEFSDRMRTVLLGANTGAGDFNDPFPTDGAESPLLEQIA